MTFLNITVNSLTVEVSSETTLREFIATHIGKELDSDSKAKDGSKLGVAAALDGAVVPRSLWNERKFREGQSLDIVTAAQGG